MDLKEMEGFIEHAKAGNVSKEEIMDKYELLAEENRKSLQRFVDIRNDKERMSGSTPPILKKRIIEKYGTEEELEFELSERRKYRNQVRHLYDELGSVINNNKNFNKNLCFSNIRELLRLKPEVKIGQIEREACVALGYMSRLEKDGNSTEPSIEFILTASKLLNVSVDTLISCDLVGLSPNQNYVVNFIEKLKLDTTNDKVSWMSETKLELQRHAVDFNGQSTHPLFTLEDFYVTTDSDYPELVTDNMYVSKTYGMETIINDDSFSLRLKNGATLFLMNIKKRTRYATNNSKEVVEAVMFVPNGRTQVLATSNDDYPIGQLLVSLYATVKEHMKHPQVNSEAMYAIDAFMNDDLTDDPEELPF